MKNIHIVPTENNKSKIAYYAYKGSENIKVGELGLQLNNLVGWSNCWSEQELYITSDEKIIGGKEWFLDLRDNFLFKNQVDEPMSKVLFPNCKKIILTTDQDLIKDGVQAIDDEFLEWFIQNPSCERVEVEWLGTYTYGIVGYKIIIPKEEPKQGTMSEAIKQVITNQLKQETLEEFINKELDDVFFTNISKRKEAERLIEMGAKWQQQNNTSKVNRVEVIQHSEPFNGRAYTNYNAKYVEIQFQDNGKTLKIFLK